MSIAYYFNETVTQISGTIQYLVKLVNISAPALTEDKQQDNQQKEILKFEHEIHKEMNTPYNITLRNQSSECDCRSAVNFSSIDLWLLLICFAVASFIVIKVCLKILRKPRSLKTMLFNGFVVIFILSCIRNFFRRYSELTASHLAKSIQQQNLPQDCAYQNYGFKDSIAYFVRVYILKFKDRCEQYYSTTLTDPLLEVNVLESITESFSILIFAPLGYAGEKIGLFFEGITQRIPFWLHPLLVLAALLLLLLLLSFLLSNIFGCQISCLLFTIKPNRFFCLNQNENAIQMIHEREPEEKIRKYYQDVSTNTDDFENYLKKSL